MDGKKAFIALTVTTIGVLGNTFAAAGKDDIDNRGERGGSVTRCSLDGVNPAFHPEVFGNAATAYAYGFVRSRDGTWQVRPDCRR
jgi:hypothetical protein